jgi:glycosyltransferase involved in cell wall biosynthesis
MESSERALRDCDALVAHWLLPAGLAVRWAAAGRRYAVVEHSSAARLLLGAGRCGALGVQGLSSGAAFVAASEPRLAARLDAFCSQGVHWLPPSTELDAFLGLETPSLRGPLQLGFLGRRVPIKGLEVLLQAFAQVRGSMRLHLAGPGQRVRAAGVVDWGALHGVEALRDFFSSIDVLVIPSRSLGSRREGFPCVLLEAWAAGRPVLASALDVLDLPLLNPGSSWRFSPGDVWGLAQRLHALASHPEQVDGEALRCRRRALAVHRYREAVSSFMLERLEVLGKRDGAAEKRDEHVLAVGA